MTPHPLFAVVVFVLTMLAFAQAREDTKVVKVALLHRHGARTAAYLDAQGNINWDNCVLTATGKRTMRALGSFLRTRYNEVIGDTYDIQNGHSHATSVLRTQQSALAALSGVWSSDPDAYPVVEYNHQNYNMGFWYSWPGEILRSSRFNNYPTVHNDESRTILGNDTLIGIGEALNATAMCTNQPSLCAIFAQDYAMSQIGNNLPCSPAVCGKDVLQKLNAVMGPYYHYMYAFDGDLSYQQQVGYYGYNLMQRWIHGFTDNTSHFNFHHYSAHDSTLIGIYNVIGAITNTFDPKASRYNLPPFGQALIAEYDSAGNVTIRVVKPHVTPTTVTYLDEEGVVMRCVASSGGEYYAKTCPLSDFANAIAQRGPLNKAGMCYVTAADLAAENCNNLGGTPPPVGSPCYTYRAMCPEVACSFVDPNAVLDVANGYVCVRRA